MQDHKCAKRSQRSKRKPIGSGARDEWKSDSQGNGH
jgi:hypothetical protein